MERGWELFFFGGPNEVDLPMIIEQHSQVTNLTKRQPAPSFSESAAILTTCDVVLAPDSSLCHLAGALDIPTVALFGPFPWQTRTKYSPKTRALQGNARCSPCFHHARLGEEWPVGGPCRETGNCVAMLDVQPERVIREITKQYERYCLGTALINGSGDVATVRADVMDGCEEEVRL
jgi:ADP-heptose:LPS heptosyltransferase